MKAFSLPYGHSELTFALPETYTIDTLLPETPQPIGQIDKEIQTVLSNPIGSDKLESFYGAKSIGIAINDKTRPAPKFDVIGSLLDYLLSLGFSKDSIKFFVGTGTHRMEEGELPQILSQEVINQYPVVIHDCDASPMYDLGRTSHHIPVQINAEFLQCDLKITVGNIEPHHFMGYSGGVKTAAIGLASRETITKNHGMLSHPQAKSGVFHINPMRQDIEEIGRKANIHYSFGTILDEDKNILKLYFGNPLSIMKEAIPAIRQTFGVKVTKPYDLVIASPGGMPKDINLYQAQKALTHAAQITRDNGWVILLAACPEGSGSHLYEEYVQKAASHQAIIEHFKNGYFEVGPHKAFQIAQQVIRVNLVIVSDIQPKTLKQWKLTPSKPTLLVPLTKWILTNLSKKARIGILPSATQTMTEITK